jgi:hypothetical protein
MALADVDGNGTLDLYVANNNSPTALGDEPNTRFTMQVIEGKPVIMAVDGKPVAGTELMGRYGVSPFDHSIREYGEPDILYLNDGAGHFTPVSWTNGVSWTRRKPHGGAQGFGRRASLRDTTRTELPVFTFATICSRRIASGLTWAGALSGDANHGGGNSSAFSMGIDFATSTGTGTMISWWTC